ncbi:unnamed protein product [Rhizoctonia solani]|uniref:C3H1-type domain-containing protein n=1 Tax=Rhizoctonia solani TaxID=456999 RepID=A0A8H2Y0E4_9AGAM|nr:unnamed protein product [Rhizoctonia solani]
MADSTATPCNDPDHASLIATVGEQARLIGQLFAKIQDLERKLEVAQEETRSPAVSLNSPAQAPNFVASAAESSYVDHQNYPAAPSAYESKKAQAQGQLCLYGSKCTREQCWYEHPGQKSVGSSKSRSPTSTSTPSQSQSTGNSAKRIKKECNYGINCVRKQCWFEHPPEWVPPSSVAQESQSQQEFETEPSTVEASSWGTNEDLSSWGATASNDWGTPVDNSWGPPAQADNQWGTPAETNSNTHPGGKRKSPANNSRSASVSASYEGSVSNSSANKSKGRRVRGKGRRADSESIATESTPMSPPTLAPTPMSAHDEPIPDQTPLSPPAQSADQMTSFNGPNPSDEMDTPSLESFGPSSSSEPEAPGTPKALWSDEPNIDVAYYPDPPPGLDKDMGPTEDHSATKPVDESVDLDQSAPSELYTSWGATGPSASDWGLDPNEYPDPTPPPENKTSGKKSKSKGKQKENFQTGNGRGTPTSQPSNHAAQSGTSTPFVDESNEAEQAPEPIPDPPQGVPQEEIPDWLLGVDEDAHTALGIPRAQSPKPESLAPPRLASTKPPPRPPLSKLAGENFPTLGGALPIPKSSQSKDDTSSKSTPTFSPRPVGWKIIRASDESSSTLGKSGKSGKSKSDSSKK